MKIYDQGEEKVNLEDDNCVMNDFEEICAMSMLLCASKDLQEKQMQMSLYVIKMSRTWERKGKIYD